MFLLLNGVSEGAFTFALLYIKTNMTQDSNRQNLADRGQREQQNTHKKASLGNQAALVGAGLLAIERYRTSSLRTTTVKPLEGVRVVHMPVNEV